MDFILNSRAKKVEIFYENAAEQQAILNFMSQYLTYKEDETSPGIYINTPGISWADTVSTTAPYAITTNTPSLSGTICLDTTTGCDSSLAAKAHTDLTNNIDAAIQASINPKEKKAYAAAKLDNTSNEGGNSYITAYVPRKTK